MTDKESKSLYGREGAKKKSDDPLCFIDKMHPEARAEKRFKMPSEILMLLENLHTSLHYDQHSLKHPRIKIGCL